MKVGNMNSSQNTYMTEFKEGFIDRVDGWLNQNVTQAEVSVNFKRDKLKSEADCVEASSQ